MLEYKYCLTNLLDLIMEKEINNKIAQEFLSAE